MADGTGVKRQKGGWVDASEAEEPATPTVTETIIEEPAPQPETEARVFGPMPIIPATSYPPKDLVWPPPPELYKLGTISFDEIVDRILKEKAIDQFSPGPSRYQENEAFLRVALNIPTTQNVTLDVIQQLQFGFEYERRKDDELLERGERSDYTSAMTLLHHAMCYHALQAFGYGSLKPAPKNQTAPKSFLDEIRERSA